MILGISMYTSLLRAAGIFLNIKTQRYGWVLLFESVYRIIPAATVSLVVSSTRMIEPVTLLTV